jgi:hypothetical protein
MILLNEKPSHLYYQDGLSSGTSSMSAIAMVVGVF